MDREEPTLNKADMANIEFRPHSYRGPTQQYATRNDNSFVWKLAFGIFLGLSMFALAMCTGTVAIGNVAMDEQAKAEAAAVAQFQRAVSDPDPFGWQRQANERAQQEAARKTLRPGQRCIKGERFERVSNGWVQLPHDPC